MSSSGEMTLSGEQRAAIRHAFDRDEYRRLFAAARDRLERAAGKPVRSVLLQGLEVEERRAIAELHGRQRIPPETVRIDLARLDVALRGSRVGVGLTDVIESLGGPIVDRRAQQEHLARTRDRMWADAHAAVETRAGLGEWLGDLRTRGLLKRAARAAQIDESCMLSRALGVVTRLPCVEGLVPLSVLASEATGDTHALDSGTPLTGLVLRAVARLAGAAAVPADATGRRALWAAVGVHCDALSCHVLALGLRPDGDGRLARHLRESAADGEPSRLTLRELSRDALAVAAGTSVFLCENPAVVAVAADELGAQSAPLICVEGIPSTAAWCLLRALAGCGARLRFHADFDWDGIKIGNLLADRLEAEPWRFGQREYEAAVRKAPQNPLTGRPVQAAWDADLERAMHAHQQVVSEECVVESLLEDLRARPGSP